jgi:hypothetical protein
MERRFSAVRSTECDLSPVAIKESIDFESNKSGRRYSCELFITKIDLATAQYTLHSISPITPGSRGPVVTNSRKMMLNIAASSFVADSIGSVRSTITLSNWDG